MAEKLKTGARGEALLEVRGEDGLTTRPILFTNRALAQAERAVGQPMLRFLEGLKERDLGVEDTAQLLMIGLEYGRRDAQAGGKPVVIDDAWKVMDAVGFTAVVTTVMAAIADVLTYDGAASGAENEHPPEL